VGRCLLDSVQDVQALFGIFGWHRDPLVISWPKGIKARGEVRHQYHHSTDIVPTILDICAGWRCPRSIKGVEQYPRAGVFIHHAFDAKPDAPTQKKRQYYAMLGTRGIWEDGWRAAALHAPLTGKGNFDKDQWNSTMWKQIAQSRRTWQRSSLRSCRL